MQKKRFVPDAGGEFPEWEEKTIEEACEINMQKEKPGNEFIYVELGDVDKYGCLKRKNLLKKEDAPESAKRVAKIDDVFFRMVRPNNRGHFHYTDKIPHQVVMSSAFVQLRMKNGDNGFLYQSLSTQYFEKQVLSRCTGTAYPTISLKEFVKLKIRIPKSIEEQKKIAKILAAYDAMIEVKTGKLEAWQAYKTAMMEDIFEGKRKFLDDDGKEFPEWEEKRLGEVADPLKYGMNASAVKYDGKNKYLRITDIDESSRKYSHKKVASPESEKISEKFLVKENDILFARTGASVGKTYLYDKNDGILYYAGYLIKAHIKPEYDSQFVFQCTLTKRFKKWVKKESFKSVQPGISAAQYEAYTIPVPCKEEQQKIGSFLAKIDEEIQIQKEFVKMYSAEKERVMRELIG